MWRALFYARELNQIRCEGSYKHRTRMYDERELRERLESLQDFTSDTEGSWTEIADRVSYTIARALIRSQVDLEERWVENSTKRIGGIPAHTQSKLTKFDDGG